MKVKYDLKIHEKDDYFFSHNTFSCKKMEIEDEVKCETVYIENGVEKRRHKSTKFKLKGEECLVSSSKLFDTVNEVVAHIREDYKEVHEDDYYLYFLRKDDYDKTVCLSKPRKGMGYAEGVVDIYVEYMK